MTTELRIRSKANNSITKPKVSIDDNLAHLRTKFFPKGINYLSAGINKLYRYSPAITNRITMGSFCFAIRKKLKQQDWTFYSKGVKQKYNLGVKQFNVYTYGAGPKVLMVHGWASNGARWAPYVEKLISQGYSAVVIDAPGHGTSPGNYLSVPDYIKCVRQVLESSNDWYSIISHSMGSLVGSIALAESSRSIRSEKIVIMSSFADCDGLLSYYGKCIGFDEPVMSSMKSWIQAWTGKPLSYFSYQKHLKALDYDFLNVCDIDDFVVAPYEYKKIEKIIPRISNLLAHGLGHNLRSEEIVNNVLAFINNNNKGREELVASEVTEAHILCK